ncbi:TRAP transporter substrate-binding protein [Halomonas sp. MCCC 1A17488]|uniref:TRAP transporter substrate-binding protein n=1 Tax=Billgrantia sulfidoxydans TaxID=2733484 RepID=A0ABX7W9V3_9GAMM|nr:MULTISPECIES: TRAP transporter substrate-binding protein [Halomonas]MCE8017307.1 TRAP transporter substrate-binding protein [Halomonas sp. MCCC 1A17488]MCG3240640.1 TRAP transporter substrate-binding protein [Halomonas sp. MCCC 1A17488]QPP49515.1 TRAP transporter substrate-binding protein [Halomonas sp. SS10-MC5]QTP56870.1 TRAP transporter substrate-binding protein [Halomonas sulfidoxydans]
MQRRKFLKTAGLGAAGVVAAPFVSTAKAQETITWDMVTSWPTNFPALGTGANDFAKRIEQLSNGRMRVRVHGAGELVPPLEVFDAVAAGTAEMGHSAAYYWRGKVAASQFFTAVPFGMNTTETNAWLYHGGGQELWDEIYAKHNLKPFPVGNTGTQPGGWFKKEINSLDDLQGIKLRLPGLAGEAMNRIGVTTVNMPGGEIFTSMQTGVLDAADWVSPYNDLAFGLHQVADYYYTSSWNEPSAVLEGTVNLDAWNELPDDLKAVVTEAARASNLAMYSEFTYRNAQALDTLVEEHGVQLRSFPQDVMEALYEASRAVIQEQVESDPDSAKVYESYQAFQKLVRPSNDAGEFAYLKARDSLVE